MFTTTFFAPANVSAVTFNSPFSIVTLIFPATVAFGDVKVISPFLALIVTLPVCLNAKSFSPLISSARSVFVESSKLLSLATTVNFPLVGVTFVSFDTFATTPLIVVVVLAFTV